MSRELRGTACVAQAYERVVPHHPSPCPQAGSPQLAESAFRRCNREEARQLPMHLYRWQPTHIGSSEHCKW